MPTPHQPWRSLIFVATVLCCRLFVIATDGPSLTKDQVKHFLLTAKVVKSQHPTKALPIPGD